MDKDITTPSGTVLYGSCLDRLKDLEDASIDSIVTDPPYELGFMGKKWDASGIAYNVELWQECLRVLKPGGHLLAFGGTRTYHRMAVAIEDTGFEIRDSIHWVYGSGFPKSHNVSIAIDKEAGAMKHRGKRTSVAGNIAQGEQVEPAKSMPSHEGITDAAKQWNGWGTALKPAHEPIVVARKPLVGTVAANVKEHGTGAINIDGCRIGTDGECFDDLKGRPITKLATRRADESDEEYRQRVLESPGQQKALEKLKDLGRWPANIIFDEAAGAELDEQSGLEASRFFYCPKPAKSERNAGGDNKHPTVKPINLMRYLVRLVTPPNGTVLDPFLGSGTTAAAAILEGFRWTGCEMTDDYLPIITGRVAWAEKKATEDAPTLPGIA